MLLLFDTLFIPTRRLATSCKGFGNTEKTESDRPQVDMLGLIMKLLLLTSVSSALPMAFTSPSSTPPQLTG